jgi:hypothetical protein
MSEQPSKPLRLFHGTSSRFREQIMKHGLRPRESSGKSVYANKLVFGKNLESHPELIYLTDTYPLQFGMLACQTYGGNILVAGVLVEEQLLQPDTDFSNPTSGVSCLRYSGTCSIKKPSLMPSALWLIKRKFVRETFSDEIDLYTGLQHSALKQRFQDAMGYVLGLHDKRWNYLDGEWVER